MFSKIRRGQRPAIVIRINESHFRHFKHAYRMTRMTDKIVKNKNYGANRMDSELKPCFTNQRAQNRVSLLIRTY